MYPGGFSNFGNFGRPPISQSSNTYVTKDGLHIFDPKVGNWKRTDLGYSSVAPRISTEYDGHKPFGKDIKKVNK